MSKQLTLSATLCVLATAALAVVSMLGSSAQEGRPATAHGSVLSVLLG